MRIKRIHHITLAVRDGDRARATFEALFGAPADPQADVAAFGVRTRNIPLGDDTLELASPLQPDSPIMRFIERRGEGFYNLALEVDNLDAALAELKQRGIRVSDPVEPFPGVRSAFVSQSATHGLSIQLLELHPSTTEIESADEPFADAVAKELPAEQTDPQQQPTAHPPLDLTPDEWSDVD